MNSTTSPGKASLVKPDKLAEGEKRPGVADMTKEPHLSPTQEVGMVRQSKQRREGS
jgi:hypothetical protein